MYDFRAQQEDELSFQRNDILKILQTDEVKLYLIIFYLNKKWKEKNPNEKNPRMKTGTGRNWMDRLDMFLRIGFNEHKFDGTWVWFLETKLNEF